MLVLIAMLFVAMQADPQVSPVDLCSNLQGLQLVIPADMERIEGWCFASKDMVIVQAPVRPTPAASLMPSKPRKPRVELRASPRMIQDSPFGQQRVLLTLVISNADEKFWCPEVVWQWPNGTDSTQEGDCVPFENALAEDLEQKSWTRNLPMALPPGKSIIKAALQKSGKTIVVVEVSVTVMGG